MAENSKIEWTTHTFNPWRGCTKIAAGCANCYADSQAKRNPGTLGIWGENGTRELASPTIWKQPLKWNRKATWDERPRVFCASLADIFEDWPGKVHDRWNLEENQPTLNDVRRRLFALIDATPNLDWLLLTKRPENIRRMWKGVDHHSNEYPPAPSEEIIQPIEDYPNYFVSNFGVVYSSNGSHCCVFCGKQIDGGVANRKYCDQRCNDNAYKARRRGKASQVEQTMRQVAVDVGEQGHCRVTLYRDGESRRELVHRLVLTAFVRPPDGDEQGCHRDRNPANNRIDNLRWGTQSGNWDDSIYHGTHRRSNKLTESQVAEIRSRLSTGESYAAIGRAYSVSATQIGNIDKNLQWREPTAFRRNCWIGCSIATQADADRNIPELLKCRDLSPVLFVSAEPLIGPVDLTSIHIPHSKPANCLSPNGCSQHASGFCTGGCEHRWKPLDWLIVGGESGTNARPMHPAWARSLRDQCQAAGVPFFFKQWGEWLPHDQIQYQGAHFSVYGHKFDESGDRLASRVGKAAAGRLLDGQEWNEFPKVNQ